MKGRKSSNRYMMSKQMSRKMAAKVKRLKANHQSRK